MNSDKKAVKSKSKLIITLSAAVVVITSCIIFFIQADKFQMPEFMRIIFGSDSKDEEESEVITVPNIISGDESNEKLYLNYTAEEILNFLQESQSYSRVFRIIYSYQEKRKVIKYQLSVSDTKYRAESYANLIICDGEKTYVQTAISEYSSAVTGDLYSEIGLTSLDELKKILENKKYNLTLSKNNRYLRASIYDDDELLLSEYDVSTEYGIIVNEYHYRNNEIYRAVVTDTLSQLDDECSFDINE